MPTQQIAPQEWAYFFDTFSRQYRGRSVDVQILGEDLGVFAMAHNQPLIGITAQVKNGPREIEVMAGDGSANITHVVKQPSQVWIQQGNNGRDSVLKIESREGISVLVEFQGEAPEKARRS
jgi:hypothetical protein